MWEPEDPKSIQKHIISCTNTFSKIGRFETGSGSHLRGKSAKRSENDPQEVPKIDPNTTQDRHQNRPKFRCENQEGRPGIDLQTLGRDPPPGRRPRSPGRGPRRHGSGPQAPMRAVY